MGSCGAGRWGAFFSSFARWPLQNVGGEGSDLNTFGCSRMYVYVFEDGKFLPHLVFVGIKCPIVWLVAGEL